MKIEVIKTTDKEINNFREKLSRIIRNVELIKEGKTHTRDGINRLDIIDKSAKDIDSRCCKM